MAISAYGLHYGFHSRLQSEQLGGVKVRLIRPLLYTDLSQRTWTVPRDFVTDFASSRWGSWNWLPKRFSDSSPPVLHDWFYFGKTTLTRAEADLLFMEALETINAGWWIRRKAYWGVRMFGGSHWHGLMPGVVQPQRVFVTPSFQETLWRPESTKLD